MDLIEVISLETMPESQYLKPLRMKFKQNGDEKYWDLIKLHDCVTILVFNTSRNVFVFVKQFRPGTFFNHVAALHEGPIDTIKWEDYPARLGITLELCSGILDNSKLSEKEIAKEEVLEECGYNISIENLQFIAKCRAGIGDSETFYYAAVDDDMKVNQGGGKAEEGELIEVIEMTIQEVQEYLCQESVLSPGGFLFAITWFMANKFPKSIS